MIYDSLTIASLQVQEAAVSYFRPIIKRHNLTEQQQRIVCILAENPSTDFRDLVYRAYISHPDLTRILTWMERGGLVLRLESINDQREFYISPAKKGQMLYNRAQTQIERAYRQVEAQSTTEKTQQLTHLLEGFIALGNSRQEAILGGNEQLFSI